MKTETFHLELITPCFCSGAEPEQQAEIRAPSIRGQLRWWFRTLGGFKSLNGRISVREQEAMIFGSTAGEEGRAGKLVVRVESVSVRSSVQDGQDLGYPSFSDPAYLTFPIQTRERQGRKVGYSGRGALTEGTFDLTVLWRGSAECWRDIRALIAVFGHLGALGLRGRRAMGALAFQRNPPEFREAFDRFAKPDVFVRSLATCEAKQVIPTLGRWLKRWRAYGRTGKNAIEQAFPGFKTAKADHDHGVARLSGKTTSGSAYRPALGLPIVQYFGPSNKTVNWEWEWDSKNGKAEGRFASPILLRPHRDAEGRWHALVIFVDAHKWPAGHRVQLVVQGRPEERTVSLDLYEAMKTDAALKPFP